MPFRSSKQRAFLFAKHPEVAKEFAAHTSPEEEKSLPEYVSDEDKTHHARKRALEILAKMKP